MGLGLLWIAMLAMVTTTGCRLIAGFAASSSHDADAGGRDLRDDGGVDVCDDGLVISESMPQDLQRDGPGDDAPAVDLSPFDAQGTDATPDASASDTTLALPHFKWMTAQVQPIHEVSFKEVKSLSGQICVPFWNFYFGKDDLSLSFTARCPGWTMVTFWGRRKAVTDDFSHFQEIPGVDRPGYHEEGVTFSNDTLSLYVLAAEIRSGQTPGPYTLWRATRLTPTDSFSGFQQIYAAPNGKSINDIVLSADQKRLYWAQRYRSTAASGAPQRIVFLDLGTAGSPPIVPKLLSLNVPPLPPDQLRYGDADPSLTASERVIVFVSNRGGKGLPRLWYATRLSKTDAFGKPKLIPGLTGYAEVVEPGISRDGRELFFCTEATSAGVPYTCHHLSTR